MDSGDTICTEFTAKLGHRIHGPEFHYTCGLVHAMAGSLRLAEAAYRRAIDSRSDYWEAHFSLAMLYADQELYSDAVDRLKTALALNPGSARICREIVRILLLNRDNSLAVSILDTILAEGTCDPHRHILQNALGRAYQAEGDYENAAAAFRDALGQKPLDPHLHVSLGASLLALGKLDEAADAFESALRLKPDLSSVSRTLTVLRSGIKSNSDGSTAKSGIDNTT